MAGGEGLVFGSHLGRGGACCVRSCSLCLWADDAEVLLAWLVDEVLIGRVSVDAAIGRWNINQAGARIERHGRPVVPAARPGSQHHGLGAVVRFFVDDGAAGRFIQSLGPCDLHPRLARNELSR